jgi:hypothetical protein
MRRNAILDRFARDAQYIPCPVWVTRSGANDVCGAPLVAYAWPYPSGASRQSPIEVRCANDHIGHFARPDKQWEYRPGSVVEKWLLSENVALADWDRLADVYREPYARSARYDTSPDKTAREAYVTATAANVPGEVFCNGRAFDRDSADRPPYYLRWRRA